MGIENAPSFNDDDLDPRGDNPDKLETDEDLVVKVTPVTVPEYDAFTLTVSDVVQSLVGEDITRVRLYVAGVDTMIGKREQMQNGSGFLLSLTPIEVRTFSEIFVRTTQGKTTGTVSVWVERQT